MQHYSIECTHYDENLYSAHTSKCAIEAMVYTMEGNYCLCGVCVDTIILNYWGKKQQKTFSFVPENFVGVTLKYKYVVTDFQYVNWAILFWL